MEIGQQILSGTSPPNNDTKNNLNDQPIKRVYSSKSKTIESFKPINGGSNGNMTATTTTTNIGNVNSNGGVFPMFKQPSYFFPPFPSPVSSTTATTATSTFVIPPFPSNNSNSLCTGVNQQVDMMKSDNEYSSSSTLSPLNQQTTVNEKSNHSIPIKKRSKKVIENSNQIVTTTDEESTQKRPRKEGDEKERQKKERRLIRNRQSAQASRERKKQYIQSLEEKVSNLEEKIKLLEAENALLRRQVI